LKIDVYIYNKIMEGVFMLRPQQERLDELIKQKQAGEPIDEIFLYWVPGAGKSLVAPIVSQMVTDDKTKLLWVVPRTSLAIQGEADFRGAGHCDVGDKDIRIADNTGEQFDPFKGLAGAVATYQTISASPKKWMQISREYKLILILDEYDSLVNESSWIEPIKEMYENSILRIPMTGTIVRSDLVELGFTPYLKTGEIDFSETKTRKWIIYDNEQALKDGSILPFEAILVGGSGRYISKKGDAVGYSNFTGNSQELRNAFETEYVYKLFDISITHWNEHRKYYPWAKYLLIAQDIDLAKEYLSWFTKNGYRAGIATSEDSGGAKEVIGRFRRDHNRKDALDILISVAMIYKGLNIVQCTHEVFTTVVRGTAWVEQALGRVRRRYKDKDKGYFFCPDDPKIKEVIKTISGGILAPAIGEYKKPEKKEKNPFAVANSPTYLESTIHVESVPYSVKEKMLRDEINKSINVYIAIRATKIIDGKKMIIHTESMKRRKNIWKRIYLEIDRKVELKAMTYDEMLIAKRVVEEITG
jgi:superfamily II DNA or RNA helicase